jgi:hypothetical protein
VQAEIMCLVNLTRAQHAAAESCGKAEFPPQPTETMTADAAFVQAVRTGDRSLLLSPYEDGLRTLTVTVAANQSAAEGGRLVRLNELLPIA